MSGEPAGELVRVVHLRAVPAAPIRIEAEAAERAALAKRFGILAVHALEAVVTLEPDGAAVRATGRLTASIEQACAVSAEPFTRTVDEDVELLFVPENAEASTGFDEEIELEADELDEIFYAGDSFDLGEAVAQTLGLAIDPYAEGPVADAARAAAGIAADDAQGGTLAAALSALKLS